MYRGALSLLFATNIKGILFQQLLQCVYRFASNQNYFSFRFYRQKVLQILNLFLSCQIHLLPFQGSRYCAKDVSLINPDELKAAKGELDIPE